MEWDARLLGIVLLSLSIVVAGVMIVVRLFGLEPPGGPLLMITVTVLVVMGAAVLIGSEYRRDRGRR
jgi:hypothetical protein